MKNIYASKIFGQILNNSCQQWTEQLTAAKSSAARKRALGQVYGDARLGAERTRPRAWGTRPGAEGAGEL